MDLSHPARDLLGENEERLLSKLATLPLGETGNRLHELAGTSSQRSTHRALARLESLGLITSEAIGASRRYRANRKHVLWDTVLDALTGAARAEQRIGTLVEEAVSGHATGALFGSFARGDAGPESDVDIVLVWDDDATFDAQSTAIDDIEIGVRELTGNDVQLVTVSRSDLRRMAAAADPLLDSWLKDARQLTPGPAVLDLLREASF